MNILERTICEGLAATPKRLPPALFYDDLGSTLFEAITLLPEYEVSRAGARLLRSHAADIVRGGPWELVELGPGAGNNAAVLVAAYPHRARFIGIDVSAQALRTCRSVLDWNAEVETIQADYFEGLAQCAKRRGPEKWLVAFLGSNLSNCERREAEAFFVKLRKFLRTGDRFLLATDLDKEPERLIRAYDDSLGVTAAFNKNLLARINREWDADFPVTEFSHRIVWDSDARRIEMHLQAERAVSVDVKKLAVQATFYRGERILTETSHRFSTHELAHWGRSAALEVSRQWIDAAWPFALTLYEAT